MNLATASNLNYPVADWLRPARIRSTALAVLLLHDRDLPMRELRDALEQQGIPSLCVRNCTEAALFIQHVGMPCLVFTDTDLPDGSWKDVMNMAAAAKQSVNVVVVGRFVDIPLYLDILDQGALDFVVPPFNGRALSSLAHSATDHPVNERYLTRSAKTKVTAAGLVH